MSANSKIEWTDHTFNPWIGCTKVSPACDHCYAERSTPSRTLGVVWGSGQPRRRTTLANWALPLRWNAQAAAFMAQHGRRQRVFCASLADVFDNEVPDEWRADLFDLIEATPNLDWLLLTKRIGNVRDMLRRVLRPNALPDNVWLGATICNQAEAERDVHKLLDVPARGRFLSMEPLLGPVNLRNLSYGEGEMDCLKPGLWADEIENWRGTSDTWVEDFEDWYGVTMANAVGPMHPRVDWVIVGGESGPQARPMHPEWARRLRDQCVDTGVPFFFKQWGEWLPLSHQTGGADPEQRQCHLWPDGRAYDGEREEMTPACAQLSHVGKKAAGRLLDGRTWDEVPA